MCGHVAAVQDFIDAGLDGQEAANSAYCECIGRYTGKGSPKKGDSSGCNWAGYGLFGIPHGGVVVMTGEGSGQINDALGAKEYLTEMRKKFDKTMAPEMKAAMKEAINALDLQIPQSPDIT